MQINSDLIIKGTNKNLTTLNTEIENLKNNIPSKIQSGMQFFNASTKGIYDFTIDFPTVFTNVPTVVCCSGTPGSGFGIPSVSIHRNSITTAHFKCSINIEYSAGADFRIYWIAVGEYRR